MLNYAEYVSGISFRFIQPRTPMPIREEYYDKRLEKILSRGRVGLPEKIGTAFEYFNTVFPEDDSRMKAALRRISGVPRMSTLAIAGMINRAVAGIDPAELFVNVGVWHGFTLLAGIVGNPEKKCVGVDNFSQFGGPRSEFLKRFEQIKSGNHTFYDMDYVDYFSTVHRDPIGFYIYDGGHEYGDQLKGLRLAEPFFSKNCVVLVDDVNWPEPRNATLDFISQSSNQYRVLLDVATPGNCHPTFWNGVLVFERIAGSGRTT